MFITLKLEGADSPLHQQLSQCLCYTFLFLAKDFLKFWSLLAFISCDTASARHSRSFQETLVFEKGCWIVLGIRLFFGFFFWLEVALGLSRLLFGKTQGWNAGFVRFFRTCGGGFTAVQAPFWGNQWWNAGFVRVGHEKLPQKANCPVHFCFLCVCVCFYVCLCVCVCGRICSMCYFFYCCFVFSFNALLFLYLQVIYSTCKFMFKIQDVKK